MFHFKSCSDNVGFNDLCLIYQFVSLETVFNTLVFSLYFILLCLSISGVHKVFGVEGQMSPHELPVGQTGKFYKTRKLSKADKPARQQCIYLQPVTFPCPSYFAYFQIPAQLFYIFSSTLAQRAMQTAGIARGGMSVCPLKVNSGSSKVVDFGTNRKRVYDLLSVINSNLGHILHPSKQ